MTYHTLKSALIRRLQRHATRLDLLAMSDRRLDDLGVSRDRLEQGARAWPWRVDDIPDPTRHPANRRAIERQAIRELNQYSDRELADLGLSRVGIVEAVRYGRVEREHESVRSAA